LDYARYQNYKPLGFENIPKYDPNAYAKLLRLRTNYIIAARNNTSTNYPPPSPPPPPSSLVGGN